MHRRNFITHARWRTTASATLALAVAFALSAVAAGALAQTTAKPEGLTLSQTFEAAWARQPELAALAARRDAARAQQQAAQSWTPEPVAVEVTGKTVRLIRNLGTREYEAGLAIPLWLPGERGRSQALAEAEGRAIESRTTAAQLRVAAAVREAWWNWQRARADAVTAQGQLDNAQRIAADVGKRLKAGDLAQADLHQADGALHLLGGGALLLDQDGADARADLAALGGLVRHEPEALGAGRVHDGGGVAQQPVAGVRRHVGQQGRTLQAGDGQRPQLSALDVGQRGVDVDEDDDEDE